MLLVFFSKKNALHNDNGQMLFFIMSAGWISLGIEYFNGHGLKFAYHRTDLFYDRMSNYSSEKYI